MAELVDFTAPSWCRVCMSQNCISLSLKPQTLKPMPETHTGDRQPAYSRIPENQRVALVTPSSLHDSLGLEGEWACVRQALNPKP